jgi:hypothetical protein
MNWRWVLREVISTRVGCYADYYTSMLLAARTLISRDKEGCGAAVYDLSQLSGAHC